MEQANQRDWSKLPTDLISLIKSLLFGRDCVIFNCVCKAWKSVPITALAPVIRWIDPINPSNTLSEVIQFPLLMFMGRDNSSCNFYQATYNTIYALQVPEMVDATIQYSKDGWLLMFRLDGEVFFFNPITKERIELPYIKRAYEYSFAFSSVPTSPDCVVLGINNCVYNLSYIHKGEDRWTTKDLNHREVDFIPSYSNPIFHKGIFYCLGMEGNLVTFDPKGEGENAWSVLPRPNKPCTSIRRRYLIESEENLLSVFEGHAGKFIKIFKLDQPSLSWKKVTSLEQDTLFVSLTSSFSTTCKETHTLGLRNTIFFPRFRDKQHPVFYSLVTGRFHCLTLDHSSSKDFFGTTEKLRCCWIQPNFEKHPEEELQWFYD